LSYGVFEICRNFWKFGPKCGYNWDDIGKIGAFRNSSNYSLYVMVGSGIHSPRSWGFQKSPGQLGLRIREGEGVYKWVLGPISFDYIGCTI